MEMTTQDRYDVDDVRGRIVARYRTQQALAEEIGVSAQTITEVLAGRSRGAASRYAIASAIGLDPHLIDWPEVAQ
jgi:transcriptional regulator with XRE-family HTH domain